MASVKVNDMTEILQVNILIWFDLKNDDYAFFRIQTEFISKHKINMWPISYKLGYNPH